MIKRRVKNWWPELVIFLNLLTVNVFQRITVTKWDSGVSSDSLGVR